MAKFYSEISPELQEFVEAQHIFFTGTAMADGHINVSPKGRDCLRVIDSKTIIWRNLTGSGNETAAHLKSLNRMTLMWCSFEGKPMILRCYGTAEVFHVKDVDFEALNAHFEHDHGARQIFKMHIEAVQTSCGFAVPLMDFKAERDVLAKWSEQKGPEEIKAYWKEKNVLSIDGIETGIEEHI